MEELLDTFDVDGNFLGAKPRSFCHAKNPGVYHKPVWIWIVNSQKQILVQKRAMTKKKDYGKWDMSAAGHVDAGESCIAACVRETREELGIETKESDYIFLKQIINQDGWELAQVYLLNLDNDINKFKLQKEEVEQVKWLNYDDFKQLYLSNDFCDEPEFYKEWVLNILK